MNPNLEEVLEAYNVHFSEDGCCEECFYKFNGYCIVQMEQDLYKHVIRLKEENERLIKCMDYENNKDEVIKCLSDNNKDLLGYIKVLEEDIKALRKQNEQLMEQHNN